jgi:hypothetical protein
LTVHTSFGGREEAFGFVLRSEREERADPRKKKVKLFWRKKCLRNVGNCGIQVGEAAPTAAETNLGLK